MSYPSLSVTENWISGIQALGGALPPSYGLGELQRAFDVALSDFTGGARVVTATTGVEYQIDWNLGNVFDLTMAPSVGSTTTFSFANIPNGAAPIVFINGASPLNPVFPSVNWQPGPSAPAYVNPTLYQFIQLGAQVLGVASVNA